MYVDMHTFACLYIHEKIEVLLLSGHCPLCLFLIYARPVFALCIAILQCGLWCCLASAGLVFAVCVEMCVAGHVAVLPCM